MGAGILEFQSLSQQQEFLAISLNFFQFSALSAPIKLAAKNTRNFLAGG